MAALEVIYKTIPENQAACVFGGKGFPEPAIFKF